MASFVIYIHTFPLSNYSFCALKIMFKILVTVFEMLNICEIKKCERYISRAGLQSYVVCGFVVGNLSFAVNRV